MLTKEITSDSPEETRLLGMRIGTCVNPGQIIGLTGPLGAGKTVFAKGLCDGIGYLGNVTSPSFSLLNVYEGRCPIYHFDLYRLESLADLDDIGFFDYLHSGRGISIVEWSDRVPGSLPQESLECRLSIAGESSRQISIRLPESCAGCLGQSD